MKIHRSHRISMIAAVVAICITAAVAQELGPGSFDLSWNTIDGGGGTSTGGGAGGFELTGTIGQHYASSIALTGGNFSLSGGFWPGAGGPVPETCLSDIAPSGGGDNVVNIDDLFAVIAAWGACPIPCPPYCNEDIDDNCLINIDDLFAVIAAWGPCP